MKTPENLIEDLTAEDFDPGTDLFEFTDENGNCIRCSGTGRDPVATKKARASGRIDRQSWIRCSICSGHGVDPMAHLHSLHPRKQSPKPTK